MGTSQRGARLRRLATEIERSGTIIVHAGIPRAAFATVEPVTIRTTLVLQGRTRRGAQTAMAEILRDVALSTAAEGVTQLIVAMATSDV